MAVSLITLSQEFKNNEALSSPDIIRNNCDFDSGVEKTFPARIAQSAEAAIVPVSSRFIAFDIKEPECVYALLADVKYHTAIVTIPLRELVPFFLHNDLMKFV